MKKKFNKQNDLRKKHLDWTDKLSSHALTTMEENKWNNRKFLPLTEDVVRVNKYVMNEIGGTFMK